MHPVKAKLSEALVQDFHSFRQALNVASADQRLLVVVNVPDEEEPRLRESLKAVANSPRILGRFHFDFERGEAWKKSIANHSDAPGIFVINPGEFGLKGTAMRHLQAGSSSEDIIAALEKANRDFAATTEKKVYSEHVSKGRREGIYFEGNVPYGEDRDGDGEVDRSRRRRGGSRRGR